MVNHKRDSPAEKSETHTPRNCECRWLRPQHGHTHISPGSGTAAWLAPSAIHVAAESFPAFISNRAKDPCLQDAGLRVGIP